MDDSEARINGLIADMSVAEKAGMLGLTASEDGFQNFAAGVPRLGIPRLILQDGPCGVAHGFGDVTHLPAPIALAATWDRSLAWQYGRTQGVESRAKGIAVAQGPCINIARVPHGGRTFEGYGEDPFLVGRMAVANIRGIQSAGTMANAKHFAANNQETNRLTIDERIDERTLREIYFPAFRSAVIDGQVASVMSAYNKVNGRFATEHPWLLTDVLKGEWGFPGFVRSDYGSVHAPVDAYNAGMDQAKPQENARLLAGIESGEIGMGRVDDAVRRVLRQMLRFGVLDDPPPAARSAVAAAPEHAALARAVAEAGAVLLKNAGPLLPLNAANLASIAVIGPEAPHTGGGGSSRVRAPYVVSPRDGISARVGTGVRVTHAPGEPPYSAAERAAAAADVAVVCVNDDEREGVDRRDLALPGGQDALVGTVAAANARTVVVLNTGGPVTMPWLDDVPAVVEMWYGGQEIGNALAAVLFGDVDPGGRLPVTFPRAEADTPVAEPSRWPGSGGIAVYSEGLRVGHRWYDAQRIAPLFPFGHGLSYTTFRVDAVGVERRGEEAFAVAATVTNTGARTGTEVVQVYASLPEELAEPPLRLVGFEKLTLQPRQAARAEIVVTLRDLAHWNGGWLTAAGRYRLAVGTSSRNLLASETVEIPNETRFIN